MSELLQDIRDQGGWVPILTEDIRDVIDDWIRTGVPFSRGLARMDILYWVDKGEIKPYRYYAARWGWGEKKAYNFLSELGLLGAPKSGSKKGARREQAGSKKGASGEQEAAEIEKKQSVGEQAGSKKGASGEQEGSKRGAVYPDSDSEPEKKEDVCGARDPDNRLGLGVWNADTMPIRDRWVQMTGRGTIDPDIEYTIRLLLQPRGSPLGARRSGSNETLNGYTPEQVLRALEDMLTHKHRSSHSLIGWVIGEMKPRKGHDANGTNQQRTGSRPRDNGEFIDELQRRLAARGLDPDGGPDPGGQGAA